MALKRTHILLPLAGDPLRPHSAIISVVEAKTRHRAARLQSVIIDDPLAIALLKHCWSLIPGLADIVPRFALPPCSRQSVLTRCRSHQHHCGLEARSLFSSGEEAACSKSCSGGGGTTSARSRTTCRRVCQALLCTRFLPRMLPLSQSLQSCCLTSLVFRLRHEGEVANKSPACGGLCQVLQRNIAEGSFGPSWYVFSRELLRDVSSCSSVGNTNACSMTLASCCLRVEVDVAGIDLR